MLMAVCPGGTEGSVRKASLSKFLPLCHSTWCCFKLGGRVGGNRRRKGEGKGATGGREEGEKEKECIILAINEHT